MSLLYRGLFLLSRCIRQISRHITSAYAQQLLRSAGPFVWYEEPIVIEPENTISQAIVLMCQEYRIGQPGKFPSRIHPYPYSPFGQTPLFVLPQLGNYFRSRIRHQFDVVDVSATFPPVSVTSLIELCLPGENFPEYSENFRNWKSSPHWNSCC